MAAELTTNVSREIRDVEGEGISKEVDAMKTSNELDIDRDPNVVNFDGPDDPENPLNWPSRKKTTSILIIALITFLCPLASTIISPATEDVMNYFDTTNETLGAFVTSVFLLGYVCGPLIIAPLSELYGRAILYQSCTFLFLVFNLACGGAPNLGALIAFRFLAGIFGSCPLTIGPGSIADMVSPERRGAAMAGLIMGPLLGPNVGPVTGGYLAAAKGWRWIFWVLSMATGVTALCTLLLKESYPYVILQRKTERLRKERNEPNLRSALDTGRGPKQLFAFSIVRPIKMLFLSPIVFILSLYMAIVYGYLYLLFTTFPRVFQVQYGFSTGAVGLVYIGGGVGAMISVVFSGAVSDRLVAYLKKKHGGEAKPEHRLPLMSIGAFMVPIGLFWYGWTAEAKTHWILPILGSAVLSGGMMIAFMSISTYLVDAYTVYAASVTAASTVIRSLLGALLPLAGNSMYNALGVGWGTSVLGFIAVAFLPAPFLLYVFGERIRKSKLFRVEF